MIMMIVRQEDEYEQEQEQEQEHEGIPQVQCCIIRST